MHTVDTALPTTATPTISKAYMPWVVCFTAAMFFFYEFIQMNMFNAIDAQLVRDFSLSAEQLGRLSASYFYANVLFLFVAGSILDRVSTRLVILTSMATCVLGTLLFASAQSFLAASLFRFFTGIGSAFCFLSCIRLASRWFPAERMALITGLIVTMAMAGGLVAQTPLTLLANHVGWRHALQIDATVGIALLVLILLVVKDCPAGDVGRYCEERRQLQQIGYWKAWRLAFLKLQNWLGGIYACLMNLPIALFGGVWGIPYLTTVRHLDITSASYVTSMLFLGTIIGAPFMGWLSDRIGRRRRPMIIGAFLSLLLLAYIICASTLSLGMLMFLFLMLGFITSTQVISYPTVAESNPHMLTATAVSVVSITVISGYGLFQPFFGWLMDLSWGGAMQNGVPLYTPADFHYALLLFPVAIIVSLLAALLIRETRCRGQNP